jgi:hypothetical protein
MILAKLALVRRILNALAVLGVITYREIPVFLNVLEINLQLRMLDYVFQNAQIVITHLQIILRSVIIVRWDVQSVPLMINAKLGIVIQLSLTMCSTTI